MSNLYKLEHYANILNQYLLRGTLPEIQTPLYPEAALPSSKWAGFASSYSVDVSNHLFDRWPIASNEEKRALISMIKSQIGSIEDSAKNHPGASSILERCDNLRRVMKQWHVSKNPALSEHDWDAAALHGIKSVVEKAYPKSSMRALPSNSVRRLFRVIHCALWLGIMEQAHHLDDGWELYFLFTAICFDSRMTPIHAPITAFYAFTHLNEEMISLPIIACASQLLCYAVDRMSTSNEPVAQQRMLAV